MCNVNVLTENVPSTILCDSQERQDENSSEYLIFDGKCYLRHSKVSITDLKSFVIENKNIPLLEALEIIKDTQDNKDCAKKRDVEI